MFNKELQKTGSNNKLENKSYKYFIKNGKNK